MIQMEKQTAKILIRWLHLEQSDLCLLCLNRPICPKTKGHWGINFHVFDFTDIFTVICFSRAAELDYARTKSVCLYGHVSSNLFLLISLSPKSLSKNK